MSAHDEESAGQDTSQADDGAVSTAEAEEKDDDTRGGVRDTTEKPEPDEGAKEKAKEMMTAYEDKPTLVMPGSGKTITGTAVSEWLDDDGNPKYAEDDDSPAAKAKSEGSDATDKANESPSEKEPGNNDAGNSDGGGNDGGGRAKDTAESERAADADETAEDENKSVEQLNEEAEQRVKDSFDKDKEFNQEILKATKQDREDREKAGK
ncbi:hypothetical protein ACX9NE_15260 [Mycobacterium sp. ML4]